MALLAYQLAALGHEVVCVDLDLEAPGLSAFLLEPGQVLSSDRPWVMDYLLCHGATGQAPDELPLHDVEVEGAHFRVAPAGVLGPTYLEKLARLDTLHRAKGKSPVHEALEALLKQIRGTFDRTSEKSAHILLDCRSGLHDLAGLALHDLAHVDVLVGRGDRQEMEGLQVLLPSLHGRRANGDQRLLVLRTFHTTQTRDERLGRQRSELHDALVEAGLYAEERIPDVAAREVAHDPCALMTHNDLIHAASIHNVSKTVLKSEDFLGVLQRLTGLWTAEEEVA